MRTVINRLPIRWRLTIWYVSLLAVMLVVFSAAVTIGIRYFLHRSLDNTLENQAALLTESIDIENGEPAIGDRRIRNRPGQQFVRLVNEENELLTDSNRILDSVSMDDPGLELALDGVPDIRWRTVRGERMRVLSQPVVVDDEVVAAVQVGLTGSSVESILDQTVLLVLSAGSFVLVFAVVGGVWLAGRALQPIDRMTRLAAEIGDQDLSQRIDPPSSDDELGRLARTFNAMLDRLEGAMNRQRQFTASASHELRTPLAMMQSQVELALSQERNPDQDTQVLETLHSDVGRLTRISNMLLTLARNDAGQIELSQDMVEVDALLELLAEQYAPVAEASGAAIHVDAEPVRLRGDEDRLVQLLVNLVDNACTHTPAGKLITLQCRADHSHATITVKDQGEGIEPQHLPHVFERFYRPDKSRGRSDGGGGLGLTISKMIVEAHNGSIDISSRPGIGTNVIVRLPRADTH